MTAVEARGLEYRYGRMVALRNVGLEIPSGSVYALLGPNGAGKTTLFKILLGMLRPSSGAATVLGRDVRHLRAKDRARMGYVAESQRLPPWMKLRELEAYIAPLYPTWDARLADDLRGRFRLDPERRIGSLSRGERMKAALLCALSPRPALLLMDEPFSGIDVVVRDELVHGVLEFAGSEGWTVVISSHEVGELEALADWVGFLAQGRLIVSESMDRLLGRFRWVEARAEGGGPAAREIPPEWLCFEHNGPRVRFLTSSAADEDETLRAVLPAATQIETNPASLRDIFVGLATGDAAQRGANETTHAVA